MAASDIYQKHNNDAALKTSAILHRVTAIKSLNSALSKGVQNYEQGNAMLATCFTLVFQSALMEDGFPEFMSFIRGCVVVAFQMGVKQIQFIFQHGLGDNQLAIMGPFLEGVPDCDPILLEAAIESTEAIGPLCQRESEKAFHALLLKIACGSALSSRTGKLSLQCKEFTDQNSIRWYHGNLRPILIHHERRRLPLFHRPKQSNRAAPASTSCSHSDASRFHLRARTTMPDARCAKPGC
jgi:hypothetical protein